MKKLMILVILLLVASASFANEDLMETFGAWKAMKSGSMLDGDNYYISVDGLGRASLFIGAERNGDNRVMIIMFDGYIGSPNDLHDKVIIFITDTMNDAKRFSPPLWRDSSYSVEISRYASHEIIIEGISEATSAIFRTFDYNGSSLDSMFDLVPEDTQSALAWLTEYSN